MEVHGVRARRRLHNPKGLPGLLIRRDGTIVLRPIRRFGDRHDPSMRMREEIRTLQCSFLECQIFRLLSDQPLVVRYRVPLDVSVSCPRFSVDLCRHPHRPLPVLQILPTRITHNATGCVGRSAKSGCYCQSTKRQTAFDVERLQSARMSRGLIGGRRVCFMADCVITQPICSGLVHRLRLYKMFHRIIYRNTIYYM